MKKRIVSILIALLFVLSSLFTCFECAYALEGDTVTIGIDETTEVKEDENEEEKKEEEVEENPQQENTYYTVDWDKVKEYKIPFKSIWKKIKKEFAKLNNVSFRNVFGHYNSFSEAVDMAKENIVNVCIGIVILALILYIIMRILKIARK